MKLFYTMLMVCWGIFAHTQTVVDIIVNSPDHNTLETAVIEAELAGALSGPGPFTVFAPTDDAFAAIDTNTLNALLADPTGDLQKILRYHVVNDSIPAEALSDGDQARSLLGQMLTIGIDGGMVMIDGALVTVTNQIASNGIVHIINAVLLPPASTVVDVVVNSAVHNTLETAVVEAGLAGALSGDGPFTVFAPTDDAFAEIDTATFNALLANPTGDLAKILRYHVVAANAVSSGLSDGDSPRSLLGQNLSVGIQNDTIMVDGAMVIIRDIETFNGVVHVIDQVLLPPASTVVDVVVNSAIHTTLESAVIDAGLAGALSGDGPFTVFAPTDAAFEAVDTDLLNELLADPMGDLAKVLRYHVLGAEVLSGDLVNGQTALTLLGQTVTVTIDGDNVMINDAMVSITDIETFNGVVHVLDAVMLPPALTVVDVVVNSAVHTTLETTVIDAGLVDALSGDGPFTVFAPTDAAFEAVDTDLLNELLADPTGDLAKVLRYHVLGNEVLSGDLTDGQIAATLLGGQNVEVSIDGDNVMINDAMVSITNIETLNGVVHVLDAVMLPPALTVVDVVVNSAVHTTLETTVIDAGLVDALSGDGPFTVFAPTDAAFEAVDTDLLNELLADPTGDLAKVLRYHVLGAEVLSTDLSDGQIARTLLGQNVEVSIDGDNVMINGAMVSVTDIETLNGVVHVLDAVILPAATVVDIVVNSDVHTILETAVVEAELAATLGGDGPFTLFAPTDDAFDILEASDPGILDNLLANPTGDLQKILLYHAVGGTNLSTDLTDGQTIASLFDDQEIAVTIENDIVRLNENSFVIVEDIETFNGVVHVIDRVLLPVITNLAELNQINVEISPNPAADYLRVILPTELQNQEVNAQLISVDGKIVDTWLINDTSTELDIQERARGTYFLLLNTDTDFAITKVMLK